MNVHKISLRRFMVIAMILFAQFTHASTGWERNDLPAGVGDTFSDIACADDTWNIFWWQRGGNLWGAWGSGASWNASIFADNLDSGKFNSMACDSSWHIVWYLGIDGYVWAMYYNGSAWVKTRIGTNQNNSAQFCVDSDYHILWYIDGNGRLWAVYSNGSSWVEQQIGTALHDRSGDRVIGCDSVRHWIWTVSSDQKSLQVTYLNGGNWATGALFTLPADEKLDGLCANPSDGSCYQLIRDSSTSAAIRVQRSLLQDGSWVTEPIWTECLPTGGSQQLLAPHNQQYMCYLSGGLIAGGGNATHPIPRHCVFASGPRGWCTGSTYGRGIPMAICQSGRAMLCQDVNEDTSEINGGMFVLWNTDY